GQRDVDDRLVDIGHGRGQDRHYQHPGPGSSEALGRDRRRPDRGFVAGSRSSTAHCASPTTTPPRTLDLKTIAPLGGRQLALIGLAKQRVTACRKKSVAKVTQ